MTKEITFDVKEIKNRRFTLPYDKAIELIKEDGEDCTNWSDLEIAEYLYSIQQEIADYEDDNFSYWNDTEITDLDVTE